MLAVDVAGEAVAREENGVAVLEFGGALSGASAALLLRRDCPTLRVLVIAAEGRHFTAGMDIGAIDLMISFPKSNASKTYDYLRETTRGDDESTKEFPAGYMFKDVPNKLDEGDDGVTVAVGEMDKWGVDMGLVGAGLMIWAVPRFDLIDRGRDLVGLG